jgi:bacillithiol system protein YtxJ
MIEWLPLEKEQQLHEIVRLSHDDSVHAVAIFKHSTRCSISSMAKNRLERSWNPINKNIPVYYLDLISFRQLSNEVANRFDLVHESPQLLLIQKGELKAHASHSAISAELIEEL